MFHPFITVLNVRSAATEIHPHVNDILHTEVICDLSVHNQHHVGQIQYEVYGTIR